MCGQDTRCSRDSLMPRIMRLYLELGDTGPGGDGGLWLKIEDCDSVWIEEPGSCFVYPAWHGSDGPRLRVSESPRLRSLHALITTGTSRHQQRGEAGSVTTLWEREDVAECYCSEVIFFSMIHITRWFIKLYRSLLDIFISHLRVANYLYYGYTFMKE